MSIFIHQWHFDFTAILIAAILLIFHYFSNGRRFTRKSPYFVGGVILLLLVTQSPIEYLGHNYLFSAHMLEHVTILLIVPPMLLAGTDGKILEKTFRIPAVRKMGNVLFNPVITWVMGVGSMWVWHIPLLIVAMKHSPALMILHTVSLLVLGIIFIWPVYAPVKFGKLTPLQCALYLFSACVGCTTLGIYLTFAPEGLYTSSLMGNQPAVLNLIRSDWGLTPGTDQQIGGLIMWVPACVVYVTNTMIILGNWFSTAGQNQESILPAVETNKIIQGKNVNL